MEPTIENRLCKCLDEDGTKPCTDFLGAVEQGDSTMHWETYMRQRTQWILA
jgi:hypothetical protein